MQFDALADAYLVELDFLEIGIDIHVAHRHHHHQRHARLNALAELYLAPRHHAIDRGANHGTLQIQLGLVKPCACCGHFRVAVYGAVADQRCIGGLCGDG